MSLRHALLGLLEDGPASGYDLIGRFERSLQQYAWTAQQSHIYPELKRLAADGLITVADEGARGRRTYALTAEGRTELRRWLLSPMKQRAVRDEQVLRLCLLSALDDEEARTLLRQQHDEATRALAELRDITVRADAGSHPRGRLRFGRLAAEYGIHQYEALRQWAEWALAELDRPDSTDRKMTPTGR